MEIIGNNSVNLDRTSSNIGTEFCFNNPFKCVKFQLDQSTCLCFITDFAKCANKEVEGKNEEKPETLAACISEMAGAISFKFGIWTPLPGNTSL